MKKIKRSTNNNAQIPIYHIETQDGRASFNFFTEAKDHKDALEKLITESQDYKNLIKHDRPLTITIKKC